MLTLAAFGAEPIQHTFTIGDSDFLLDGKPFQIRCGEVHAPRVPREYWRHRLKMVKAMGLNSVCAYLFWNMHEPLPGQFNWSDQADAATFIKIAQEEGLWVILRPGPYACAEWEMGGFPWWLLKQDDIKLRTRDPRYLEAATRYLKEVGRVIAPLQVTHGGPILMVQVENEYGFYGKDSEYMGVLRQALIDAGFDVPLFACNPAGHLRDGYRDDLFPVVNFGTDPAGGFAALRKIHPTGPLMCGEFYPGWFDTWGAPHHLGKTDRYLADLEYMLKHGASFSIYMAHGGTSFGLWSGADRPFKPDTSSYDYDAPISEAGWPTEKFKQTRDLMAKYLLPGETIPDAPSKNPVMSFAPVESAEYAPIFANLPEAIKDDSPQTIEKYDQAQGCILYRSTLPAGPAVRLEAAAVHDFAFVFVDGQRVGVMDRRNRNFKVSLPKREKEATLDILVEAMGRVNFGQEVHDRKGVIGPVKTESGELKGWQIFRLPLDASMISNLKFQGSNLKSEISNPKSEISDPKSPAFWRFTVNLPTASDTFLDLRNLGKGVAWINGHCLGRYWNIGPTQTMYAPGPWLKKGSNEIVVLDLLGPQKPVIAGLDHPILDELHPDLDFSNARRPHVTLALTDSKIAHTGSFAPGAQTQDVQFSSPARGRYFAIESLSAHDNKPFAAIAELDLLDESGKPLSHEGWTIAYVDSEERTREDGSAENAIDGQVANFWHTQWGDAQPPHPHRLILDLGQSRTISALRYVPRQGSGVAGRIKDYKIYVGDDLVQR
jgi:beta-galactosidase